MEYNTIFSKSFSKYEQKKFGYGAVLGCFVIVLTCFTVFKPSFSHLPILNLRFSMSGAGLAMLMVEDTSSYSQRLSTNIITVGDGGTMNQAVCNVHESKSDFCEIDADVRIIGNSSTVYFTSPYQMNVFPANESYWKLRPYPRKTDNNAMRHVTEVLVKPYTEQERGSSLRCNTTRSVPAIIFSLAGYAGNHFHDFSEVLVPLFLTSHKFNREVQFLITNLKPYWIVKYRGILEQLTSYPIIDMDKENQVLCYPRAAIGLRYHKELSIDPLMSPTGSSMEDFAKLLRKSYSLKRSSAIKLREASRYNILRRVRKPRLLIISRKKTRTFTNVEEIVKMAKSLGYEVVVMEPGEKGSSLAKTARIVNSCDVMMGVHGAGLTNLVYLPRNAILIQIIPLGGLEWLSRQDFGEPAMSMKVRYLEYKIKEEESSLIEQYPLDHDVIRNPHSISKQGWGAVKAVYLNQQNVKLNVDRFRDTLLEALELLHH